MFHLQNKNDHLSMEIYLHQSLQPNQTSKFPGIFYFFLSSSSHRPIYLFMVVFFCYRIQDVDGSYFELFTSLAWKQDNQRQNIATSVEKIASDMPPSEQECEICPIDYSLSQNEKDKLYVEMLYTIANAVRKTWPIV